MTHPEIKFAPISDSSTPNTVEACRDEKIRILDQLESDLTTLCAEIYVRGVADGEAKAEEIRKTLAELVAAADNAAEWIRRHSLADDWPFCLDTLRNRIDKSREVVK